MRVCYKCGKEVPTKDRVGRNELCSSCSAYLHCCLNCSFYDQGAHNQCRENQAELVADKESGNFCDYFQFSNSGSTGRSNQPDERTAARAQLDNLFGKKL